jgi:hypothetical protein
MAWVEQVGQRSWRVRYRTGSGSLWLRVGLCQPHRRSRVCGGHVG